MMKKFICETHSTEMIIDDEGNRKININYNALNCYLPGLREVRSRKVGSCIIREVDNNA
jgi:hypothetical protein